MSHHSVHSRDIAIRVCFIDCNYPQNPTMQIEREATFSGTLDSRCHKTVYRKFETNIPRTETARPQSKFLHSCFCERFIYFHDRSAYSAAAKFFAVWDAFISLYIICAKSTLYLVHVLCSSWLDKKAMLAVQKEII